MKKFLILFLMTSFWANALAQGDPPPYVKGQSQSGLGNLGSTIQVPKNQSTKLNSYQARIETGNTNELRNPSFEGSPYNSGWTCPIGTISQAVGPDGFKALGIVSSGSGFECNQTFTSTADLKGTLARFFARVKTSAPNTFVCGLDGGSSAGNRVNCQKVSLTTADKVFSETSGFFNYGNMVYGIAIYSSDTAAFPTVIDDVSMGVAGLTTATIQSDTVYSAVMTTSTAAGGIQRVTPSGSNWISGCSNSNAMTCTLSGFSQPPNCAAITNSGTFHTVSIGVLSSTSISISTWNPSTNALAAPVTFSLVCQKTGSDYTASSTSAILSSNADTNWTNFTPTGGWTTNTTYTGKFKYVGDSAVIQLKVATSGAPGGNTALSMDMPALIGVIDTAKLVGFTSVTNSGVFIDTGTESGLAQATVSSSTRVTFTAKASSVSKTYPMTWASGDSIEVTFTVPIVGRTQSPIAIIPLAETVKIPGANQADHIRVRFGAATISNPCTTGICNKSSMSTTSPTSITWGASGSYNISFPRTYGKIMCTGTGIAIGVNYTLAQPNECTNCSSLSLVFGNTGTGGSIDTSGVIDCLGTY